MKEGAATWAAHWPAQLQRKKKGVFPNQKNSYKNDFFFLKKNTKKLLCINQKYSGAI